MPVKLGCCSSLAEEKEPNWKKGKKLAKTGGHNHLHGPSRTVVAIIHRGKRGDVVPRVRHRQENHASPIFFLGRGVAARVARKMFPVLVTLSPESLDGWLVWLIP